MCMTDAARSCTVAHMSAGHHTEPEVVEARVNERLDLVDRIAQGDLLALGELFEHATGATVKSVRVEVTPPRAAAS